MDFCRIQLCPWYDTLDINETRGADIVTTPFRRLAGWCEKEDNAPPTRGVFFLHHNFMRQIG